MDYKDYYWLNEDSRTFLSRGYISESAEERVREIAIAAESILQIEGFANKFENYMSKGFYSLSTPVWINFAKDKGLPISCYGSYVDDSLYFGSSKELEDKFTTAMSKRFKLELQGWSHWFLGTRLYREEDGSYILDQEN